VRLAERRQRADTRPSQALSCTVLLEVAAQEYAPELFARVLAHLGWGPDTTLSWPVTSYCKRKIPAWDRSTARPLEASGLTVAQLAELPLSQLREAAADAITASMPWCPSARVLADLVTSSPVLSVSPDWRVGLALLPRDADSSARAAAAEYLAALRAPGADSALVADDFQQPLLRWARQLAGELSAAPVVLDTRFLLDEHGYPGDSPRRCPECGPASARKDPA
jgi:hypothetical protein